MKIAYVYDGIYPYTFGGVEKRIWELAIRLVLKGHEVHLFGPKFWAGVSIIKKENVYLHGVCKPPKARFVEGRRSITWPIYFAIRVLFPLLKVKFDIIDCQNFPYFPCFSAKLASVYRRSRLIITWHEVWGDYWYEYIGKKGIFGATVEKLTTWLSSEMIAVSELTKRDLATLAGTNRIEVIPNGIDWGEIRRVKPTREQWDIVFVGRLIKEKNVDLLVKSISHIRSKVPSIKCLIIGDGPERQNIQNLIAELSLEDAVRLAGRVEQDDDVHALMKSSKVFVSLSVREGFGMVALEANACGLPVVTVRHPRNAICELVREGESGFLCEFSEEDIAEKILLAMDNRHNWEKKCIEFAQGYDWDKIANIVELVYKAK